MFEHNVTNHAGEVFVDLKGRLDAAAAPTLYEEMAKLRDGDIRRVTFRAKELEYISSAGLRIIIFAKQKLGADTQVFMEDVNDDVKQIIEVTGCDSFISMI